MSGEFASRPIKTFEDYYNDANIYMNNGEYIKAAISFEKALSINENDLSSMYGLASAYAKELDYEGEEIIRKQIAEFDSDNLDNDIRLIEIMIHNGKLDDAKQKTEELIKSDGTGSLNALYKEMIIEEPLPSLNSGIYDNYQLLEMTTKNNNELIYYTMDGTEPTKESILYSDGIIISYPETKIRAKAIGALGYESNEIQLSFSITKPVENINLSESNKLNNIVNSLFNLPSNAELYNYELAQIRTLYIIGDKYIESKFTETIFSEDSYSRSNSYTSRGNFDLDFVEYMPFLQTLVVGYQDGLDLSPLASLKYIQNLSLLNNNITDISPLGGLNSLRRLALGWNDITDVSAIANLQSLESLGLWNNNISDVSTLNHLENLTYFDISYNHVAQIDCLKGMPNISELWINNNNIQDISPLDNCSKLTILMQGNNPISNSEKIQEKRNQLYKTDLEW